MRGPQDGKHYDAMTVTNPAAPQRGTLHIDDDGSAAWEFPGTGLDDDGIGRLIDEAVNALRASRLQLPRRQQTVIAQRRTGSSGVPSRAQLPAGKENAD